MKAFTTPNTQFFSALLIIFVKLLKNAPAFDMQRRDYAQAGDIPLVENGLTVRRSTEELF